MQTDVNEIVQVVGVVSSNYDVFSLWDRFNDSGSRRQGLQEARVFHAHRSYFAANHGVCPSAIGSVRIHIDKYLVYGVTLFITF